MGIKDRVKRASKIFLDKPGVESKDAEATKDVEQTETAAEDVTEMVEGINLTDVKEPVEGVEKGV